MTDKGKHLFWVDNCEDLLLLSVLYDFQINILRFLTAAQTKQFKVVIFWATL